MKTTEHFEKLECCINDQQHRIVALECMLKDISGKLDALTPKPKRPMTAQEKIATNSEISVTEYFDAHAGQSNIVAGEVPVDGEGMVVDPDWRLIDCYWCHFTTDRYKNEVIDKRVPAESQPQIKGNPKEAKTIDKRQEFAEWQQGRIKAHQRERIII